MRSLTNCNCRSSEKGNQLGIRLLPLKVHSSPSIVEIRQNSDATVNNINTDVVGVRDGEVTPKAKYSHVLKSLFSSSSDLGISPISKLNERTRAETLEMLPVRSNTPPSGQMSDDLSEMHSVGPFIRNLSPIRLGTPLKSLPTKLFVSDSEHLHIQSTSKKYSSPIRSAPLALGTPRPQEVSISSFPRSTPVQVEELSSTPARDPRHSPSRNNILDFNNWFSESDGNSSLILDSLPKRKLDAPVEKSKSDLKRPATVSDPIESGSSSPFKQPPPKKQRKQKIKTLAPVLPPSDIAYDLKTLNDANKATRSKDELLSEMTLSCPLAMIDHDYINLKFTQLKVISTDDERTIFWKRKVTTKYDSELDIFIPCAPTEIIERNLIVYFKADDLVQSLMNNTTSEIINQCKQHIPVDNTASDYTPYVILLIEGYDKYISKLKSTQDRLFKKQVRQELDQASQNSSLASSSSSPKKRKTKSQVGRQSSTLLDIALIEKKINQLQVLQNVNVFFTKNFEDSIDWLHSFTYTIASNRYDNNNESKVTSARTKCGTDTKSTFLKVLQQFKFITEVKAERVFQYYNSLSKIYDRYVKNVGLGKALDGTSNIVPPTTDLAMRTFFMSNDPEEVLE